MSVIQPNIERAEGFSQNNTGMASSQPSVPYPQRTYSAREAPQSYLQPAPPMSRDFPLSQRSSGMVLDNAILNAFRFHIGIHNDPSLSAGPTPAFLPGREGTGSRSIGDVVSTIANTISTSNTAVSTTGTPNRPASNLGIYNRVIAAERKYHREYKIFSVLINGALGLQMVFAAALTALGASNGPHTAVTLFGALNTVLAGLLTFLKGSGLPNRLKYYENEWIKLREYIEQRERDFASDCHRGRIDWDDLTHEIAVIEERYENVRRDIEANTPDSYVSMSNAIKSLNSNHSNSHQLQSQQHLPPSLAKGLSRLNSKYTATTEDAGQLEKGFRDQIRGGISEFEDRIGKGMGDLEKQAHVHVREVSNDVHERARNGGRQAEQRVVSAQQSINGGLQRSQSAAETRFRNTQNAAQLRYDEAQTRFVDAQNSADEALRNAQNIAESRLNETQNLTQSKYNDVQMRVGEMQNSVEASLHRAQDTADARLQDAQNLALSRYNDTQSRVGEFQQSAESSLRNAQNAADSRIQDMQYAASSGLGAAQSRMAEAQQHGEAKVHNFESKLAMVAERAAEKVLEMTKHRHG